MGRISKLNLTPNKQSLLLKLIQSQGLGSSTPARIPVREDRSCAPLSFAQKGLWFIEELAPGNPAYNDNFALRLAGKINIATLQQGLNEIINRHEILRTAFKIFDREPVQVVKSCLRLVISIVDLDGLKGNASEKLIIELAVAEARSAFNLNDAPLVRLMLVRLSGEESLLLFTIHHIVSDGWSMGIITKELATLYERFIAGSTSTLPTLRIQYCDFADWQKEWVGASVLASQLPYWKDRMAGAQSTLDLIFDHPRPATQSFNGASEPLHLSPELNRRLKSFCQQNGSTLFMVMLSAFKALLHRYTGKHDILIGTPVAGRYGAETEGLIGLFVNILVLRTEIFGELSFEDLHARVRETALSAFAHQDLPFESLVESFNPKRGLSYNPLFQVVFSLQNEPPQEFRLPGLTLQRFDIDAGTAKFDLTLDIIDSQHHLAGRLKYNADLFETVTIQRLASHFRTLLEGIVSDSGRRLEELPLLSEAERHQLEKEWNEPEMGAGGFRCIHQLFEDQVERSPEAIAVVFEEQQLSYGELNRRANQLARYLQGLGIEADVMVGICVERCLEMVVGVLSVLKAGGAYVPLDPSYPASRLAYLMDDVRPPVLLTLSRLGGDLPSNQAAAICLDNAPKQVGYQRQENPESLVGADNLAYTIYTSGSAGQPKGVMNSHSALSNHLLWRQARYPLTSKDSFLQKASLSFDISIWEICGTLIAGARLVLARSGSEGDSNYLVRMVRDYEITVMHFGPAMLRVFLNDDLIGCLKTLRHVYCGGEALTPYLQESFFSALDAELHHQYGPTETSIDVTVWDCEQGSLRSAVPIGRPIRNTRIYVLDQKQGPVALGAAGELCISGSCLARGYLNGPELTAERFRPDALSKRAGGRLYRAGDLARYQFDGAIEFIGRLDQPVKLRGYRIELGEIEAALMQHRSVAQCAVSVCEDELGEKRLVAFVTPSGEGGVPGAELREYLRGRLPGHMVPSSFVTLERMPLNSSGKLDRQALPKLEGGTDAERYVEPRNEIEEILCGIWSEILRKERVGVEDNFFELGGHSLLASQVMSRIPEVLGVEIPLRKLFTSPTVAGLAAEVTENLRAGQQADAPRLVRVNRNGDLPLSFAQQRLWVIDQLHPETGAYIIGSAVRVSGKMDVAAVVGSLVEITRRHEVLRTDLVVRDGRPEQHIKDCVGLGIDLIDFSGLAEVEGQQWRFKLAKEAVRRTFDLARGPLLRVKLLRVRDDEHVLLVTMHHVVSDGSSVRVMMREFSVIYEALRAGRPSPLKELVIQYADYAVWQRQWLQGVFLEEQLGYWRRQLAHIPALELQVDHPPSAVIAHRAAGESFKLSEELTRKLREKSRREGVTLFMTLLAGFQALLARYSGQEDIAIGTPIAGNNREEIEGLIGFFVNTLVMRTDLSGNPSVRELLRRVRETTLGALAHQDLPFEKLVEELRPERNSDHQPLFQVVLAFQNFSSEALTISGLKVILEPIPVETAKFELAISVEEQDWEILGWLEYDKDLYEKESVVRMIEHLRRVLEGVGADEDRRVMGLPLLGEEEWEQVVSQWNQTTAGPPVDSCVHELIAKQVELAPEATAVVSVGHHLTYNELNRRANKLGRYLSRFGVGPEARIGVYLERGPEMVIAWLGALKAGGAYVPLDPAFPPERLNFMSGDARLCVLLTQSRVSVNFVPRGAQVLRLDVDWGAIEQENGAPLEVGVTSQNLAYVIYTSGSTGRPKGVEITHAGLLNLISWHHEAFHITGYDRATQLASLAFDACGWELWPYLTAGAMVYLGSEEVRLSSLTLSNWLVAQGITICFMPTPLAENALALDWAAETRLRYLLTGGDQLHSHPPASLPFALVNNYGPTESSVVATSGIVKAGIVNGRKPTIGSPIANTEVYLLDWRLQPLPLRLAGELCVGGAGLARGYLGSPDLTAERFVPDGVSGRTGRRLYRTGDLARWNENGELDFCGRQDNQVKIRGYRIELGEIETVLGQHAGVRQSAVGIRNNSADDKRLVAYVVPSSEEATSVAELREYLRGRLPEYMVPSEYVELLELPLTANGKLDRQALPAPLVSETIGGNEKARTAVEEIVAVIFEEVLRLEHVGINQNFFELGGHSLLATRVISRIRDSLQIEVPLRTLFENPSVAGMAEIIERGRGADTDVRPLPIHPVSRGGILQLSYAQRRLWFLQQLNPESATYIIPLMLRLRGAVEISALRQCLEEIVRRHEALRTRFETIDGNPTQVVERPPKIELRIWDLKGIAENEMERKALEIAALEAVRPFDLERGPVWRTALVWLGTDDYFLLLNMHHVASDGWSVGLMVKEFTSLYEGYRTGRKTILPKLLAQYADFAAWQQEWLQSGVLDQQLNYWRRQLTALPALELPSDRPRLSVGGYRGGSVGFSLPTEFTQCLKQLSRREGVSLFMLLLAGFQSLLARYSGQKDFAVGTPVAGRNRTELEALIGFFVNTLVMRASVGGNPTFNMMLGLVRETALGAYAHQDLPFEKLVEELRPQRDLSRPPLFQVMFQLNNFFTYNLQLREFSMSAVEVERGTGNFDLSFWMREEADRLVGKMEYNQELYNATTINRMLGHFRILLKAAVTHPDGHILSFPLLGENERRQLLSEWNDTQVDYSIGQCLHEMIEAQPKKTPDATAVIFELEHLSYHELNERANQLAHYLRRLSVGPEVIVGVCLERSIEMVVALLGVLKAGGAYLPLDPNYPRDRLAFILKDAQTPVLLSLERLVEIIPDRIGAVVCLDANSEEISQESKDDPVPLAVPLNLAYLIYTSGSSGVPKGVTNTHQGICNRLLWMQDAYQLDALDRVLQKTPYSFDVSIWELFWPLLVGAQLVVARPGGHQDSSYLVNLIAERQITTLHFVPSMLYAFLEENSLDRNGCVRRVMCSGEALRLELKDRFFARLDAELHNLYGPTEASVDVTFWNCERDPVYRGVHIGRPIANIQIYLPDAYLEPAPVGAPGDLHIGGIGLARGYHNRADLTAERFIPDPYNPDGGTRLYQTGDIARYLPDGNIEYLGRADHQVKIRGFRIELQEIETLLIQRLGVQEAVVVAQERVPGDLRIAAYVVPCWDQVSTARRPNSDVEPLWTDTDSFLDDLWSMLEMKLPEYMVPSTLTLLNALPLTPSGKIDRRMLPVPDQSCSERESAFVAPRTPIEAEIAKLWRELLHLEQVSIYDNFFDLGGHSLILTRLVSRINNIFQVDLTLRTLFDAPTIVKMAEAILARQVDRAEAVRVEEMIGRLSMLSPDEVNMLLDAEATKLF